MKRLLVLLAAALLLLAMLVPASAEEEATTECVAKDGELHRGDTVEVTVVLKNCAKLKSMGIVPVYDPEVFELVEGKWLLTGAAIANFDEEKELAAIAFASEVDANGEVFAFTLKVKADAPFGESKIVANPVVKNGAVSIACTGVESTLSVVCKHSYSDQWSSDENNHWKECREAGCGERTELGAHVYDNACDADCNVCGHTRKVEHSYAEAWSSDGEQHWHECTVCGAKADVDVHTFAEVLGEEYLKSEANCASAAEYYKSCTVCGAKGTETFTHGEKNPENHTGNTEVKGAVEATCTTEGYSGDVYCADCGAKLAEGEVVKAGHTLEKVAAKEATHEADGNVEYYRCTVCGKLFADALGEKEISLEETVIAKGEHVFGEEFASDAEHHWKECGCGAKTEEAEHTFGEWKVTKEATAAEDGSRERACTVCGFTEREVVEAIGSDNPDVPQTGDRTALTWLVLIASACSIAAIAVYAKKQGE